MRKTRLIDSSDQQRYRKRTEMDSREKRESTIAVTAKGSWRGRKEEKSLLPETSRVEEKPGRGEYLEKSDLISSPGTPTTYADMAIPEKQEKKIIKIINKKVMRIIHTKNMTRKEEKILPNRPVLPTNRRSDRLWSPSLQTGTDC